MTSELSLEIVTPFGKLFSEKIRSCIVPGSNGQFQILKDHAALVSSVDVGYVKIEQTDARSAYVAVGGGFCEVKDNQVEVIVESAEFAETIDINRAKAAKKRADERLSSSKDEIDMDRARLALARALNRLKISELR